MYQYFTDVFGVCRELQQRFGVLRVHNVTVRVHKLDNAIAKSFEDKSFENEALIEGIFGREGLQTTKTWASFKEIFDEERQVRNVGASEFFGHHKCQGIVRGSFEGFWLDADGQKFDVIHEFFEWNCFYFKGVPPLQRRQVKLDWSRRVGTEAFIEQVFWIDVFPVVDCFVRFHMSNCRRRCFDALQGCWLQLICFLLFSGVCVEYSGEKAAVIVCRWCCWWQPKKLLRFCWQINIFPVDLRKICRNFEKVSLVL